MSDCIKANGQMVIATSVVFIVIFSIMCLAWIVMWLVPTLINKFNGGTWDDGISIDSTLSAGGYSSTDSININCSIHLILIIGVIGLILSSLNLGSFNILYNSINK